MQWAFLQYKNRTGLDSIKSIDGKIAKAQKDIDEMTTAFIEAKNALLRANIEKRMNDYERLIQDLQEQKKLLERERGRQFTKKDLFDFIAELIKGDPNDKEYQKKLIDNFVVRVYVGDDYVYTQLNLANANDVAELRFNEMKNALEHLHCVQTQSPLAQRRGFEPPYVFLRNTISSRAHSTTLPSLLA